MDGTHNGGLAPLDAATATYLGQQQLELIKRQIVITELSAENARLREENHRLRLALIPTAQTPDHPLE